MESVYPVETSVTHAHVVKHGFLGGWLGFLVTDADRQHNDLLADAMDVAEVEGRVDHHLEGDIGQCLVGKVQVRVGSIQVAAQQEGEVDITPRGSLHALQRVHAAGGGQFDPQFGAQAVEDLFLERRGYAHGTDTLNVAVASQGQETATGCPDHAAQQRQIADGLDILHALQVV